MTLTYTYCRQETYLPEFFSCFWIIKLPKVPQKKIILFSYLRLLKVYNLKQSPDKGDSISMQNKKYVKMICPVTEMYRISVQYETSLFNAIFLCCNFRSQILEPDRPAPSSSTALPRLHGSESHPLHTPSSPM